MYLQLNRKYIIFLKMFRNLTPPGHLSQPLPIMNLLTYLNFSLFNKKIVDSLVAMTVNCDKS